MMKRAAVVLLGLGLFLVAPALAKPPKPPATSAVTITAAPSTVTFGGTTTISGKITGKKAAGVSVDLQSQPAPYTGGFTTAAKTTADSTGHYSFKVTPSLNTNYRVVAHTAPAATSSTVPVKVRVKVTLHVGRTTVARGHRVRFSGLVVPAYNGKFVQIQRKTATGWRTMTRAKLFATTASGGVARSKYSKRVRITRSGSYRVRFNPADNLRLPNTSPTRHITVS
jgi:hypothetical protein